MDVLYFRFFKVSLSPWFSNSLEWVPIYAEHLLAALPSLALQSTHPKPSQSGLCQVVVKNRSSDLAPLSFFVK